MSSIEIDSRPSAIKAVEKTLIVSFDKLVILGLKPHSVTKSLIILRLTEKTVIISILAF